MLTGNHSDSITCHMNFSSSHLFLCFPGDTNYQIRIYISNNLAYSRNFDLVLYIEKLYTVYESKFTKL